MNQHIILGVFRLKVGHLFYNIIRMKLRIGSVFLVFRGLKENVANIYIIFIQLQLYRVKLNKAFLLYVFYTRQFSKWFQCLGRHYPWPLLTISVFNKGLHNEFHTVQRMSYLYRLNYSTTKANMLQTMCYKPNRRY